MIFCPLMLCAGAVQHDWKHASDALESPQLVPCVTFPKPLKVDVCECRLGGTRLCHT